MAYYLASQGGPLCHCVSWCNGHAHPCGESLTSQRISEILRLITVDGQQTFLKLWMNTILENEYICYDITSISSYSKVNDYIKFGYNRDGERLPQLNLAMLFGQESFLSVYF